MTEIFDPSSITTWISLSAAALLLIAFIARTVINSKIAEKLIKKDTYSLLKSIIFKTFWIVLVIVIIAGLISIIEIFVNNKMKKVAEQIQKSEQMLHDWSLIEDEQKESALESLKQATNEFESYENLMLYATALGNQGRFNEALNSYNQALTYKKTKELFLNKGIAEQSLGKLEDAKTSLHLALTTQSGMPNKTIFDGKALFNLSTIFIEEFQVDNLNKNLLDSALFFFSQAELKLNQQSKMMGELYSQKALVYEFLKDYDNAEKFYIKAINVKTELAYTNEEIMSLAITNNNAATLLLKTGYIEDAIRYSEEAIFIFNNAKNYNYLGYAYYTYAEAHEKIERYDLATKYYKKARESFNISGVLTYDDKISKKLNELRKK